MSTVLLGLVWPLQLPPSRKAVLVSLADQSNDEGFCWPSIDTICRRTCLGRTCVIESISALEQSGYLQANRENGRRTTYTLTLGQQLTSPPRGPVHQAHRSATRTIPVRQADTKQHEPSGCLNTNNNSVVVLDEFFQRSGLLTRLEHQQILAQLTNESDTNRRQMLADELAGALRARGRTGDRSIKNPARFLASFFGLAAEQLTYAPSEAALRAGRAAAHERESPTTSVASQAHPIAGTKPSPEIRARLNAIRSQLQQKQQTHAN